MAAAGDETGLSTTDLMRLTADIMAAYVGRNVLAVGAVPGVLSDVYQALHRLGDDPAATKEPPVRPRPAVPIARSVQQDHIVCLEDGKKLKMLKRYLRARFGLSPDEYRRKWGLAADYPMVAPAYAERRSQFAKEIGLGRGVRRGSA